MSGKLVDCKITDENDMEITCEVTKRNGKTKSLTYNKSDIFSVTKSGQETEIYYIQVEELGDWMTIDQMQAYIAGEADARNNYSTKWIEYVGYIVGSGIGYISGGGFLVILSGPIVYTGIQFLPQIRIKEKHLSDKGYAFNDFYLSGFEPVARSKRVISALKSSIFGAILGTVIYFIVPYN